MTTTAPRRRGRPAGSVGQELLTIAREMFIAKGYRGTTMDAVAAAARISKQSLYAAYASKNDLFAAVVHDWVDQGYDAGRPLTDALRRNPDVRAGLLEFATTLQGGILSEPVLQMRTLVAAESDAFPEVAADYVTRSWERNLHQLSLALRALTKQGLLAVDDAELAAEQFVWLVVGGPLNRLSLRGAGRRPDRDRLCRTATEAVTTFLCRYGAAAD